MNTLLQIWLTMKPDDPLYTSDEDEDIDTDDANELLVEDDDETVPAATSAPSPKLHKSVVDEETEAKQKAAVEAEATKQEETETETKQKASLEAEAKKQEETKAETKQIVEAKKREKMEAGTKQKAEVEAEAKKQEETEAETKQNAEAKKREKMEAGTKQKAEVEAEAKKLAETEAKKQPEAEAGAEIKDNVKTGPGKQIEALDKANSLAIKKRSPQTGIATDTDLWPFHYGPDPFKSTLKLAFGSPVPASPCTPCKLRHNRLIRHKHHSTSYFYEVTPGSQINCPSCKVKHPKQIDQPEVALFTTSTLHNFFLDPAVRMSFHMDIESICSGKYVDLYNAWLKTYKMKTGPVNILVLAGINDITQTNIHAFEILLRSWSYDVTQQNSASTIRFIKAPQPPMFVWFDQNGPPPAPDYINYLVKVSKMNEIIDQVNAENGHKDVVGFSHEGCRSNKRKRDGNTVISHCFGSWREIHRGKRACLHLNNYKRSMMAKKLVRFVVHKILN